LQAGAIKLARLAVSDVVHWAAAEAIAHGLDRTAVTIVESGVERVAEVGIDRTLEELKLR